MKGTGTKKFGCIAATALLAVSALGLTAFAEETETETVEGTAVFEVTLGDGEDVTLKNKTDEEISGVTYTPEEGKDEGTLVVTEEDGTEHTFEDADLTEDSDFDVIEKLSFFYVVGEDDESDDEFWHYEDADAVELSETVVMYVLADMNVRDDADKDADIIGSVEVGNEVEVTGGTPIWFSVTTGDDEDGYIAARYLTDDKEEAEKAAENEAAAAQAATSETQAETTAQSETAQSETAESETPSAATVDSPNGSGSYYQVDGVWYEDVAPDSDAGGYYYQVEDEWYQDEAPDSDSGYFYYETADGKRYRILDSDAVYVGYDDPEQDAVFGYDTVDVDGTAELETEDDIDDGVDAEASDAGGYYFN